MAMLPDTAEASTPQESASLWDQVTATWDRLTGQTAKANDLQFPGVQPSSDVLSQAERDAAASTGMNPAAGKDFFSWLGGVHWLYWIVGIGAAIMLFRFEPVIAKVIGNGRRKKRG